MRACLWEFQRAKWSERRFTRSIQGPSREGGVLNNKNKNKTNPFIFTFSYAKRACQRREQTNKR